MERTTFSHSIETQLLIDFLRSMKNPGEASYEELSACCGRDVRGDGRQNMYSAIKAIRRDDLVVWATVRGKGLRVLDNAEVVDTGSKSVRSINRQARRGLENLACADYGKLTNQSKTRHNGYASLLSAVALCSKPAAIKKVEVAAESKASKLTFTETLKSFGV